MSPHCPLPSERSLPNRHTCVSPHSSALDVSNGLGERGWRGWEKVLLQTRSYLFPWSGMASQLTPPDPTISSPRLGWGCRTCKFPHRLKCCFTSAEDLTHGVCRCNTCRCLKHAHPGRGKYISTEACSLLSNEHTDKSFSRAYILLHTHRAEPPMHHTHARIFLLPAAACGTARKTTTC